MANYQMMYNEIIDDIKAGERAIEMHRSALTTLEAGLEARRTLAANLRSLFETSEMPLDDAVLPGTAEIIRAIGNRPVVLNNPTKTLVQRVQAAIDRLHGEEFVVGDVAAELDRTGDAPAGKNKNSKITTVLKRLTDSGAILMTFRGGGNVPNRYRDAKGMSDAEQHAHDEMTNM